MSLPPRNPLFLPQPETGRSGCPKCGHPDYTGYRSGGIVVHTCLACRYEFGGGLPQEAYLPDEPRPAEPARLVSYEKDARGQWREVRRAPSPSQSFRTGHPLPPPGEEDV